MNVILFFSYQSGSRCLNIETTVLLNVGVLLNAGRFCGISNCNKTAFSSINSLSVYYVYVYIWNSGNILAQIILLAYILMIDPNYCQ